MAAFDITKNSSFENFSHHFLFCHFITYLSASLNPEEMYNIVIDAIMNDLSNQLKGIPKEK